MPHRRGKGIYVVAIIVACSSVLCQGGRAGVVGLKTSADAGSHLLTSKWRIPPFKKKY